mgnify:CR=1 FL=1
MSDSKKLPGHLAALFCTLVWGTTFISTKVLLRDFNPIEILFFRFALGFAALWLACPHALRLTERKQEWLFAGAGLADAICRHASIPGTSRSPLAPS